MAAAAGMQRPSRTRPRTARLGFPPKPAPGRRHRCPDHAISYGSRPSLKRRCEECDTPAMRAVAAVMRLPVLPRSVVAGAVCAGVPGCVTGLVLGLLVYPPTAWFAVFEL